MPAPPSTQMAVIEFVRFGEADTDLVRAIAENTADVLGASYVLAAEPLPLPESAYSAHRHQHLAGALIDALRKRQVAAGGLVLGITEADLYAPGLNFVFGQAELGGGIGVISLARLRPEFWGRHSDDTLLVRRGVKEAVHELGHAMGLPHCTDPDCVMHFSNSLADTDRKGERFCARCAAKLP